MAASFAAVIWSWRNGAMLNYGDAVAHLHIARRLFDARTPRLSQLGSVWLPLPHLLLAPFVRNYFWWATGLAGAIPSSLAYIASCAGLYRLARHWLAPAAAALALVFFALNPNLLYLQTTAMSEPLFICETIWIVLWLVEWRLCLDNNPVQAGRLQSLIAAALVAAVFTRYDGWIIAFIAWSAVGLTLLHRRQLNSRAFWLASVAVVAAPIAWFVYNSVCFGDWLYFSRGPYSAKVIELRTAAPSVGPPHPGWHNLWVSLLFYLKSAELDAVAAPGWKSAVGNLALAAAALGTVAACLREKLASRRAFIFTLLLWLPAPFYAWSIAYGSVPIFFPAWWPFTWYNTRYGMEFLPAFALGLGFAAHVLAAAFGRLKLPRFAPAATFALLFALAALNLVQLLRQTPIVYTEGAKNAESRQPFDEAIPPFLQELLSTCPRATILMNTSVYPELVAYTGIPFRQTINESDLAIWRAALAAPARSAAIVIAFDGDEIDRAVKAHPADLTPAARFAAPGQSSATVYLSSQWTERALNPLRFQL